MSTSRFSRALRPRILQLCVLLFVLLLPQAVPAQWTIDPAKNVPIIVATDAQQEEQIVGDGSGGAIIVWTDYRSGLGKDIYAQRVDFSGRLQWNPSGVLICGESGIQDMPKMRVDGAGGAIIVWEDKRSDTSYDIYAQRINPSGAVLWTAGGVPVCAAAGDQEAPDLVIDGNGGAVVAWTDTRTGRTTDIYAQRIDSTGKLLWAKDGVPVPTATIRDQFTPPSMVNDGLHGAFIVWNDIRNVSNSTDIYGQRMDSSGTARWDTNGVAICAADADQHGPRVAVDGSGGVIVCWTDFRSAPNSGVYAQRVNAAGQVQWAKDGVVVNDTTDNQQDPEIVTDRAGGAVIAWTDHRNGTDLDIYAQRLSGSGARMWNSGGVPLCTAPGDQAEVRLASDRTDTTIAAWTDRRGGNDDIYAQRINGAGVVQWAVNGIPVSTAPQSQGEPQMIMASGKNAIVTWTDGRGTSDDIYAQNIDVSGVLGLAPSTVSPVQVGAVGSDSVRLVWTRVLPVSTKYWLDLATDSAFTFRTSDSTITDSSTVVKGLTAGTKYWWRVRGFDKFWGPFSDVGHFTRALTGVAEQPGTTPRAFSLSQNYPNPFNPSTTIAFTVPRTSPVTLEVFDDLGRRVATLAAGTLAPGTYHVRWDARSAASGVYYYRMTGAGFTQTRALMLLK